MRILVLTNLYPPYFLGGYEIGCRDVVDELSRRGHEIRIITSRYGVGSRTDEGKILRIMHGRIDEEPFFDKLTAPLKEVENRKEWIAELDGFQPDLVSFWNLSHISLWCMTEVIRRKIPSACYLSDQWFEDPLATDFWSRRTRGERGFIGDAYKNFSKTLGHVLNLGFEWPPEKLPELHCTSDFIRQGVSKLSDFSPAIRVIHWGVANDYLNNDSLSENSDSDTLDMLFVGQLVSHKGVMTAVRGVIEWARGTETKFRFRLAGGGPDEFRNALQKLIDEAEMTDTIILLGRKSRNELLDLYRSSQIYIFPSEWDEPFAISPLEAMASGCAVIGTTTGGSREIFRDGENSMTFPAGDFHTLAQKLGTLDQNPALMQRIAAAGQAEIRKSFTLSKMVDEMESRFEILINE